MLSSYAIVEVMVLCGSLGIFQKELRYIKLRGDGFDYIWKCQNESDLPKWYAMLTRSKSALLPTTLKISSDFSTTTQIKRYK